MSPSESPRPALTEDDVDGLLTRFFEDEVPAELRSRGPVLPPASPRAAASRGNGGSRSAVVILLAGLCCVIGVALLIQPEGPQRPGLATSPMLPASPAAFAAPLDAVAESEIVPRVPGVEDGSHFVPVGTTGDESPARPAIEVMIPELEVEIFPPPPPGTR